MLVKEGIGRKTTRKATEMGSFFLLQNNAGLKYAECLEELGISVYKPGRKFSNYLVVIKAGEKNLNDLTSELHNWATTILVTPDQPIKIQKTYHVIADRLASSSLK